MSVIDLDRMAVSFDKLHKTELFAKTWFNYHKVIQPNHVKCNNLF